MDRDGRQYIMIWCPVPWFQEGVWYSATCSDAKQTGIGGKVFDWLADLLRGSCLSEWQLLMLDECLKWHPTRTCLGSYSLYYTINTSERDQKHKGELPRLYLGLRNRHLPSLVFRRRKWDMIQVYKILHGLEWIHNNSLLKLASEGITKGQSKATETKAQDSIQT